MDITKKSMSPDLTRSRCFCVTVPPPLPVAADSSFVSFYGIS